MNINTTSFWTKRKRARKSKTIREIDKVERRALRRELQQQRILSIASNLFWKNGFLGTSIDDIAKKLNVNKATIYYYFEDKHSLLYEIITAPSQALIDIAKPIIKSNMEPKSKLKSLIITQIEWELNHVGQVGIGPKEMKNLPPKLTRKYIAMRDIYENFFEEVIREGIEKGTFSFADAKLGAMFTLGLINSIIHWYKPKGKFSADKIASEASTYILKALEIRNVENKTEMAEQK